MRACRSCVPLIGAVAVALFGVGAASASTVRLDINVLVFEEGSVAETNTVSITVENGAFTIIDRPHRSAVVQAATKSTSTR